MSYCKRIPIDKILAIILLILIYGTTVCFIGYGLYHKLTKPKISWSNFKED